MKLDYNTSNGAFLLRVPRGEGDIGVLMKEHGLDFSLPDSTDAEAVLFTYEPYAAVAFHDFASKRAMEQLRPLQVEIEASWAPDDAGHYRVPVDKELWGFQKADLAYALRRKNTLVGDQPGLGKTQIAIAFANEIGAKRVLCIVPASIRFQWVRRIQEWSTMTSYHIHTISSARNGVHPNAAWTIVSYELARNEAIGAALAARYYDCLIIDEAHYLKTIDARRTRAVFGGGEKRLFEPIASRAETILALTGTPLPNRPREAYTLSRGLNFDAIDFMSFDRFSNRFNPSKRITHPETGKIYIDERSGRHAELQSRLRVNFMTRHLKRDVMTQLQLPVYDLIQVEETGPVRQALAAERLLDIDPEALEGADFVIDGEIATARRLMGIAMAPQVAAWVDMLIDGGEEKIVLFAWHREVLAIYEKTLAKHGILIVHGGTGAMLKDAKVAQFIKDPECQVIAGNLLTLGTGTDGLQDVAWHALIGEPDWTPGNNVQAFDRLDRGGQKNKVQGDIFVAPGSIAEKVLAGALRKMAVVDRALDRRIRK